MPLSSVLGGTTGGDGAASKTLTEQQERLLSGKDIQVPAGVPMDSRYLDSLKSFIGDEASKAVESTEEKEEGAEEEEEVRPGRASVPATPFRLHLRLRLRLLLRLRLVRP